MSHQGERTRRMSSSSRARDIRYGSIESGKGNGYEDEHEHFSNRSNWLRAAVLGANDGLVSTAALLIGICAGGSTRSQILLAGLSGLIGGAFSMALGEYVSVWSQKDAELADIEKEKEAQAAGPESRKRELLELAKIYEGRGLSQELAHQVAVQLTEHDVIAAHARDELNIDLEDLANPVQAAVASAFSFATGAAAPLLAAYFANTDKQRLIAICVVSVVGLTTCGATGSALGGANMLNGAARVCIGGIIALAATYGAGALFGEGDIA